MCGIAGLYSFRSEAPLSEERMKKAVSCLAHRGPDGEGLYISPKAVLGHRRLSIVDLSEQGAQPMADSTGRYIIVFNGEFYNYKEHRDHLLARGIQLRSQSDTEVLLYLFILEGPDFLQKVNGFFALAIYDTESDELFIARDRLGVKPLLIYQTESQFLFASEMKALIALGAQKELDHTSLYTFLQLNYIPGPDSIFRNIKKLEPGHFLHIRNNQVTVKEYYRIPYTPQLITKASYEDQVKACGDHFRRAVEKRMVADVPVGAFLSGGLDSSITVAVASQYTTRLKTFSLGYKNEPYFDETRYAMMVAKKYNTDHTVFQLGRQDLLDNLFRFLDSIDEPFADSSALAVYILSSYTSQHVKVVLSGDGADELFAGYNKHYAENLIRTSRIRKGLINSSSFLWKLLPQSRANKISNTIRQLNRFSEGMQMPFRERYWRWCGFAGEADAGQLMLSEQGNDYFKRKEKILSSLNDPSDLNQVLYTDMRLVLPYDMLTKTDLMSMSHGLEVRSPFLDYELVNFAFTLPVKSKINGKTRKRILRDSFRKHLPPELLSRRKQGFEVPLLNWFREDLRSFILEDTLHPDFVRHQGIFDPAEVEKLKVRLFSSNPGDIHARIWGLIVFQYWWKKWMGT
jgi:asparagine synthase (glutamine-hydrolysing)